MDILYHSAPPTADTGYGICTKNLAPRFNGDHNVDIYSVSGFEGMGLDWEGIQIYPAGGGKFGQKSIPYYFRSTGADVVFSHHDHWAMHQDFRGMQETGIPMILYTILDNGLPGQRPSRNVVKACEKAMRTVVISKWAESRLRNSTVPDENVEYIPHGVNTSKYAPVPEDRISESELKRDLGVPEDCFLFGMVAANYGPRKNIPQHMEAFNRLVEEDGATDAYLYLHSHPQLDGGFNLHEVRDALNLDPERVLLPDPHEKYHGIDDLTVVQLYNTFDCHLNVSQAEGWGLTITEALSCETPVICANNTAQTEQMGVGHDYHVTDQFDPVPHGLLVNRGAEQWTEGHNARRFLPLVDDIHAAMRYAYENPDEMAQRGERGRRHVVDHYQWDHLYETKWKPLLAEVESELAEPYNEWYMRRREAQTNGQAFESEAHQIEKEVRGRTILDAGCGPGGLTEVLANSGYDVTAMDISQAALDKVRERETGATIREGDVRSIPLDDDSVDSAVAQHVLEHVEADGQALAELVRVARERVVVLVPMGGPHKTSHDSTEERLYTEPEIERLIADFEALSGADATAEYEKFKPSEASDTYLITVDIA